MRDAYSDCHIKVRERINQFINKLWQKAENCDFGNNTDAFAIKLSTNARMPTFDENS